MSRVWPVLTGGAKPAVGRRRFVAALSVLATVAVAAACGSGPSGSAGDGGYSGTLVVASFGGSFDEALNEVVVKPFEKKYGVNVEVVTVLTSEVMAKLRAQGARAGYDVVQFSGGQETEAFELGLISPLNGEVATNAADANPAAKRADGKIAPAYAFNTTGIIYNVDKVRPAPTSWDVLSDPKYAGKVGIPDISVTAGQNLLISLARINGGGESSIDPGFDALPALLKNSRSVFGDGPTMTQLLGQEQIVLSVFDSGYGYLLAKKGLPVRFAIPDKGGVLYGLTSQVVKGGAQEKLAWEWVNFQLDPQIQVAFAERAGYAPTNGKAKVEGELKKLLPLSSAIDRLEPSDAKAVAENRAAWTERWNKLVGKR